jgi:DnaJ-class molecular chaperone
MSWWKSRWRKCRTCNGTGKIQGKDIGEAECPDCKGKGKVISPSMM